jgi:isopropylmalate/homocitrate/citramalate synthase
MKLSTLKQLIKNLGESAKDKDELLTNIINLIELYEKDNLEDEDIKELVNKEYQTYHYYITTTDNINEK